MWMPLPAPWIDRGARILDAGSGGGFPGIPLCILRPDLSVTLVDSVRKKVSFLKYAIRMLGLTGIDAVHGRLEDLGALPLYRGNYDVVVCRAFSALDEFAKLTLPYISPSGRLLAMKGPQADHDHEAKNHRGDGTIILGGRTFSIAYSPLPPSAAGCTAQPGATHADTGGLMAEDRSPQSIKK
jgi:16S rRNA (guanine(527)-N(7))-methyltransferase RsmG